jgi:hypothetical protein
VADIDFPADLIDLQRASHRAWAEVEQHRKTVDAARVADADAADEARRAAGERIPEIPKWGRRTLRPWTEAEDAEHDRLLTAAREAAEALRARLLAFETPAGASRYDVTQQLHKAARAEGDV